MNARLHKRSARSAGTTLVEVLIVVAILGLVLGSVSLMGLASDRAFRTGTAAAHLEAQAVATTERVVVDLRTASLEFLTLDDDGDDDAEDGFSTLDYLQALDLEDGEVQWSGLRHLAFEYEAGEVDDGLDNNGNGLRDEGLLVLIEESGTPNERRRVLTRWVREHLAGELPNDIDDNANGLVDEQGFVAELVGETLVIRLTLERLDADGRVLTRSTRTSARLRN